MTARVINDPGSLGWEYDPVTERWTWSGNSGDGGGGGGSFPEAPVDGKQYGRQDAGWTEIVGSGGGGGAVTTADVQLTNPTIFAPGGLSTQEDVNGYLAGEIDKFIADAPADSEIYGRQNNAWVSVPTGGGGSGGNDPRITNQQITNWDISFGWGNHADAGYLTSFTEADPTVPQHVKDISQADINNWNSGTGGGGSGGNDPRITDTQISNWDSSFSWGNHASQGYLTSASLSGYATQAWVGQNYQPKGTYLTSETDPTVPAHVKSISQADINKWNSPPAGGSTDTFDDVCQRGSSTNTNPSAGNWYTLSNTYTLGGSGGAGSRCVSYDGKFVFYNSANGKTTTLNTNGNVEGTSFTSWVNNTQLVTVYGNAIANSGSLGAGLYFSSSASSPTITPCVGNDFALRDNFIALGNPSARFTKVWAVNGAGALYRHTQNGNEAVLGVRDLIGVLEDLREATREERTVDGLRDSIGNCVGGIVERLEAIQAETEKQVAAEIAMFEASEPDPMPSFTLEPTLSSVE